MKKQLNEYQQKMSLIYLKNQKDALLSTLSEVRDNSADIDAFPKIQGPNLEIGDWEKTIETLSQLVLNHKKHPPELMRYLVAVDTIYQEMDSSSEIEESMNLLAKLLDRFVGLYHQLTASPPPNKAESKQLYDAVRRLYCPTNQNKDITLCNLQQRINHKLETFIHSIGAEDSRSDSPSPSHDSDEDKYHLKPATLKSISTAEAKIDEEVLLAIILADEAHEQEKREQTDALICSYLQTEGITDSDASIARLNEEEANNNNVESPLKQQKPDRSLPNEDVQIAWAMRESTSALFNHEAKELPPEKNILLSSNWVKLDPEQKAPHTAEDKSLSNAKAVVMRCIRLTTNGNSLFQRFLDTLSGISTFQQRIMHCETTSAFTKLICEFVNSGKGGSDRQSLTIRLIESCNRFLFAENNQMAMFKKENLTADELTNQEKRLVMTSQSTSLRKSLIDVFCLKMEVWHHTTSEKDSLAHQNQQFNS